jgi:hypothetical protein
MTSNYIQNTRIVSRSPRSHETVTRPNLGVLRGVVTRPKNITGTGIRPKKYYRYWNKTKKYYSYWNKTKKNQ